MAAPAQYWIDPTVASDGGAGTEVSPWTRADGQCLAYAFSQITPGSWGEQILIVPGTAHTANTASIVLATEYQTPTFDKPLWITSSDLSVGRGDVSQDAYRNLISTSASYVHLQGLTGSNVCLNTSTYSSVIGNDIAISGSKGIDSNGYVFGNRVTGTLTGSNNAIEADGDCRSNHVVLTGTTGAAAIYIGSNTTSCSFNAIVLLTSANALTGIRATAAQANTASNNSIWCNAGTGYGIWLGGARFACAAWANVIEGFSGTGGIGVYVDSGTRKTGVWGNSIRNCATAVLHLGDEMVLLGLPGNETLGSTPFTDGPGEDLTPLDVGEVLSPVFTMPSGVTSLVGFRGAICPPSSSGSGGSVRIPNIRGGADQ